MTARTLLPLTDEEYLDMTLGHWLKRYPGVSEVTVIVRNAGRPALVVRMEPGERPVILNPDACEIYSSLPAS